MSNLVDTRRFDNILQDLILCMQRFNFEFKFLCLGSFSQIQEVMK